jgi:hypothetical protein
MGRMESFTLVPTDNVILLPDRHKLQLCSKKQMVHLHCSSLIKTLKIVLETIGTTI